MVKLERVEVQNVEVGSLWSRVRHEPGAILCNHVWPSDWLAYLYSPADLRDTHSIPEDYKQPANGFKLRYTLLTDYWNPTYSSI